MKTSIQKFLFLGGWIGFTLCPAQVSQFPALSPEQLKDIGNKIWKNEGGQRTETLTWWNKGEPCASMGIGHFIWYPKNVEQHFTQTFPTLLAFLKEKGVQLPSWLKKNPAQAYCPWQTHEEFFANINHKKMNQLRDLLASTIELQTQFIIKRSSIVLDEILMTVTSGKKNHLKKQFYKIAQSPNGLFALIDYYNFKGAGINPKERYKNQGWGLLQVLERMNESSDQNAVKEFARIAQSLLEQRVQNAPSEKNENRFLLGWCNRIKSYAEPL